MQLALQYIVNGLMLGIVYSMIGVGFSLIFGIVRVLNFAYGEFFMIAAYMTFFLASVFEIPIWIVFVVNFILMFVVGWITERILIKPLRNRTDEHGEHSGVIIATFGLQVMLQALALLWFKGTHRSAGNYTTGNFMLGNILIGKERLFMTVVSIVILLSVLAFMKYSKIGCALRAVSQNRTAAQLSGINVNMVYGVAFGLSTALVAIAGTLLLPFYNVYPTVGVIPMGKAFSVTLIGGLGNIEGAILAGPILGVLEALASGYISTQTKDAVAFACVILVLIAFPGGLGKMLKRFRTERKVIER
jgi:branched-chain amino acid transport system permease protein